jgi:hypothetical protein
MNDPRAITVGLQGVTQTMMQKTASVLMMLALASCGSSSGSGSTPSDLDRFLGTWTISSGTLKATCPQLPIPISTTLMGEQTVQKGTDSDLIFDVQPMCRLLLDVSGNNATIRPRQVCMVNNVAGTVDSGTLTVSGENATFNVAGNAMVVPGTSCTFTADGTSARTAGP